MQCSLLYAPELYSPLVAVAILSVEEQAPLVLDEQLILIVKVTRNRLCPETHSPVLVTFGATLAAGGDCQGQKNATEMAIASGTSASFYVDAATIILEQDEIICFIVSLDGVPGELTV